MLLDSPFTASKAGSMCQLWGAKATFFFRFGVDLKRRNHSAETLDDAAIGLANEGDRILC